MRDATGHGHDAFCSAGECPSSLPGMIGNAAKFGGAECLRVLYAPEFQPAQITFMAWANVSNTATQSIVGTANDATPSSNSWAIEFPNTDAAQLKARSVAGGDEFLHLPGNVPHDSWLHYAGVWDGQMLKFYFTGANVDFSTVGALVYDTKEILIGCDENGGTRTGFFNGAIDDVRLYGRALTDQEIATIGAN